MKAQASSSSSTHRRCLHRAALEKNIVCCAHCLDSTCQLRSCHHRHSRRRRCRLSGAFVLVIIIVTSVIFICDLGSSFVGSILPGTCTSHCRQPLLTTPCQLEHHASEDNDQPHHFTSVSPARLAIALFRVIIQFEHGH